MNAIRTAALLAALAAALPAAAAHEDGNEYTIIGCMAKGVLRVVLKVTDNDLNKDAQVFCDSFQKNPETGQFEWVRVNSIVPHRAEELDE